MFSEPTSITKSGIAVHGGDESVFAEFFYEPMLDETQSTAQGRPVYRDVPHIRICIPGDNTRETIRPVNKESTRYTPSDMERFPRQWEAFMRQEHQHGDGTPLEHWPMVTKAQVKELKALDIHTVEMLAAVSDVNLKWMGARQLRDNAKIWLEEANNGAGVAQVRKENEDLKARIASLEAMFHDMQKAPPQPPQVVEVAELVAQIIPEPAPLPEQTITPMQSRMRGRPKKDD